MPRDIDIGYMRGPKALTIRGSGKIPEAKLAGGIAAD